MVGLDMKYHAIPSMTYDPSHVILHVGTNDITTTKPARNIARDVIKRCDSLKKPDNEISASGIIYRRNEDENIKVDEVKLHSLCAERHYHFIDNSNIPPRFLRDHVDLHKADNDIFFSLLLKLLRKLGWIMYR